MSRNQFFTARLIQVEASSPPEPVTLAHQHTLSHTLTKAELRREKARREKTEGQKKTLRTACELMSDSMLKVMAKTTEHYDRCRAIRTAADVMVKHGITYDALATMAATEGWKVDPPWVQVVRFEPEATHKGWMDKEKWYLVLTRAIGDFFGVHVTSHKNLEPPYLEMIFCGPVDRVRYAGEDLIEAMAAGHADAQTYPNLAADFWLGFGYGLERSCRQNSGPCLHPLSLEPQEPSLPMQPTEPPAPDRIISDSEHNLTTSLALDSAGPAGGADKQQANLPPPSAAPASLPQASVPDGLLVAEIATFRHAYYHPRLPGSGADELYTNTMNDAEQLLTARMKTHGMRISTHMTRKGKLQKWEVYCQGLKRGKKVAESIMRRRGAQP